MVRKNKRKNILESYSESFDYLKKSINFIYIISGIFVFFILFGFFIPAPEPLEKIILEFIEQILAKTQGLSAFELTKFIFLNNLQSSFFGIIFGIILGIFSIATIVVNGYLLGFVAAKSVSSEGIFILWRLFPHGIFELPAVLISMALGLKLGTFIFKRNKLKIFRLYLWESFRAFILIIIPLLLIAAIIEGILIFLSS